MVRNGVTLETVTADTLPEFRAAFAQVFSHGEGDEASLERARHTAELERMIVARHAGGAVVGTAGNFSFEMSLPWAEPAGCAGVTAVSVRADHRRRGLLRRMMSHLMEDAVGRGEPFAALWASEAPIYGRFGFGPAAPTAAFDVERAHMRFRVDAPVGDIELVDAEVAAERFPAIYDAARRTRHATLSRSEAWWRHRVLSDPSDRRDGAGAKRFALLGDRGYAIHRLKPGWGDDGPEGTVQVQEIIATDPEAAASLWRFVIDTDLSHRTTAHAQPLDDPLPLMVDDPLRAYPGQGWALQVRLVDVPGALAARGYRAEGSVTFELHDAALPANAGRWRLAVADGRGTCEPTDASPQLTLDAEALATVSLGGVRVTQLATAGRIQAHDPAAVPALERLLATDVAPWHGGMF